MIARVSETTGVILRRYVQAAIDRLLIGVPMFVLLFLAVIIAARTPRGDGRLTIVYVMVTVIFLVLVVGNWLIEVWVPHRWLAGTPGMRWLGLRVVTEDGEPPRLRACVPVADEHRGRLPVRPGRRAGHRVQPAASAVGGHGRPYARRPAAWAKRRAAAW